MKKRFLFLLVPVLAVIANLCVGYYVGRKLTPEDAGTFLLHTSGFLLLSFCLSFFLTHLYVNNRRRNTIMGFIALYTVSLLFPVFLGKVDVIYSTWSLIATIKNSSFGIIFYLGFDWYKKDKKSRILEKQNLQNELALLKNQINPHFLFNTLNNIDSLIKSDPDQASHSLIGLSDIMRYMLYETNAGKVPLKKELTYIENYIELQKLQYANPRLILFEIKGDYEGINVYPMLFITFIENAFKHCTDKSKEHAIRLSFNISEDVIRFRAINIVDQSQVISKDASSGIGLESVRRRLELLYPDSHVFQIDEKNDLFCVSLNLYLNGSLYRN